MCEKSVWNLNPKPWSIVVWKNWHGKPWSMVMWKISTETPDPAWKPWSIVVWKISMENPDPSLCEKLAWKTLIHRCGAHAVRSSSVQQIIMSSATHKVTTFCLDLDAPLLRDVKMTTSVNVLAVCFWMSDFQIEADGFTRCLYFRTRWDFSFYGCILLQIVKK